MRRKLLLVNLVLLAVAGFAAWQLRASWRAAQAREQARLNRPIKPVAAPPAAPPATLESVTPGKYIDIADKMLFSKDRNSTVVVETPVKPPKPMPALPLFFGVMDLGDGPTIMMAEKKGAPTRDLKIGESIGEFKLVAVNSQEITLEWDGKTLTKPVAELARRAEDETRQTAVAAPPPAVAAAPPPPPKPATPGVDTGRGTKACQPGDNAPAGTIADGYRKVVTASPFNPNGACFWEAVK